VAPSAVVYENFRVKLPNGSVFTVERKVCLSCVTRASLDCWSSVAVSPTRFFTLFHFHVLYIVHLLCIFCNNLQPFSIATDVKVELTSAMRNDCHNNCIGIACLSNFSFKKSLAVKKVTRKGLIYTYIHLYFTTSGRQSARKKEKRKLN